MKQQQVSVKFSTPRYRALCYYLEKEGKNIEGELQKKLDSEVKKNSKLEFEVKNAEQKASDAEKNASAGSEEYKREAERAKAEADNLRRQLQMSDPVTAEFKGVFEQASAMVVKLQTIIKSASPEVAPRLQAALSALGKQLGGNNG